MPLKYDRVSLKLSGEAISGNGFVIDPDKLNEAAAQVARLVRLGVRVGVTIGGGNIMRGRSAGEMERNRADHMGMLATVINSLALGDALTRMDVRNRVMSSVAMNRICEEYTSRAANAALDAGEVVIFAGGSGLPFLSTDTAAALKAAECGCQVLLMAKNVDGVYSADPNIDKTAVRYSRLTYTKVIEDDLHATDLTAITFCSERHIPILVFGLDGGENIVRAVMGEDVGTVIED